VSERINELLKKNFVFVWKRKSPEYLDYKRTRSLNPDRESNSRERDREREKWVHKLE
jgi:hypothetical protein